MLRRYLMLRLLPTRHTLSEHSSPSITNPFYNAVDALLDIKKRQQRFELRAHEADALLAKKYPTFREEFLKATALKEQPPPATVLARCCTVCAHFDLADAEVINGLYTLLAEHASTLEPLQVYIGLDFLQRMGVAHNAALQALRREFLLRYRKMNAACLAGSLRSLALFEGTDLHQLGVLPKIFDVLARKMRHEGHSTSKVLTDVATAMQVSNMRHAELARRVHDSAMALRHRRVIRPEELHTIVRALGVLGFEAPDLHDAFLTAAMETKGVVLVDDRGTFE